MKDLEYDAIIIGGGISGLYILNNLKQQYPKLNIKLLERDSHTGGRIKTKYYRNGQVKFETGPWRIHHTHLRTIKLIESLSISYRPNSSSHLLSKTGNLDICQSKPIIKNKTKNKLKKQAGLSLYENIIFQQDICQANITNEFSKIPQVMDSTVTVYDNNLANTGQYFVLDKGLSYLIDQLSKKVEQSILTNHLVTNITMLDNQYHIDVMIRDQHKFTNQQLKAKHIFLCLPPFYIQEWDITQSYLQPVINSIGSIPLNHIYAKSPNLSSLYDNKFQIFTNGPLSQIISGDYNNDWFQISYSGGSRAQFWNRLKMKYPEKMKDYLQQLLDQHNLKIPITKIESFYWDQAIHYWKPQTNFNLIKAVENSIYPDPINLPNLFMAGEAISGVQGWIEGALQTADMAIDNFSKL